MKSFKFLASVLMLAAATTASAQFVNSNSNSTVSNGARNVDLTGWQRVTFSYNPTTISIDETGYDNLKMNGFSIGYAQGFSVAKQVPLFIEAGINAQFAFKKLDGEDSEDIPFGAGIEGINTKFTTMNLNIPVNLAYKFTFNNGNTSLVPYAGINFKFNLIGKCKYTIEDTDILGGMDEDDFWDYAEENGVKQTINMFDKKETGDKDATWNRFQMGWQIGVGLYHNHFYVGVGYTKDFIELCKKTKVGYANISVGYSF